MRRRDCFTCDSQLKIAAAAGTSDIKATFAEWRTVHEKHEEVPEMRIYGYHLDPRQARCWRCWESDQCEPMEHLCSRCTYDARLRFVRLYGELGHGCWRSRKDQSQVCLEVSDFCVRALSVHRSELLRQVRS